VAWHHTPLRKGRVTPLVETKGFEPSTS
jgi:hypothetical protein